MVLSIDIVVVLTKNVGVLHVSCRTFQAVQTQQTQAEDIIADGRFVFIRGEFSGLTLQVAQIVADQLQIGHRVGDSCVRVDVQALCFQGVAHGDSFTGIANNTRGIEVNVSQRGEERTRRKVINLMVDDAVFTCFNSPCRQTL